MPKVSVIMPVYNGAAFVEQAVGSVFDQTLTDWELILIDDGSTDATPQIVQAFTDQRIKVVRQENAGEAHARNVGLTHASGEYIAFLDVDDAYYPNALEDLSTFLDRHPDYGVVYSNGHICNDAGDVLMSLTEIRPGIFNGNVLEQIVLASNLVTVPVCTMTRRADVCDHSIQFDRNLVIGPDWDFWIQLAGYTEFGYLDRITCRYRVHNSNITRKIDRKKRRRDQIFGRLKVMNSHWFDRLSTGTQVQFFANLLVELSSGEPALQMSILESIPFSRLPDLARAYLWRMVGIDVLQTDTDHNRAKPFLLEALKLAPRDKKTRMIYASLKIGRNFALSLVNTWRVFLFLVHSFASPKYHKTKRLQKLFGLG